MRNSKRNYLFLFVIYLIFFQYSFGQFRPEIENLLDEIINYGKITSAYIGYSGSESPQYKRFMQLDSIATENELVQLIEHKSPIVRCIAFPSLCQRNIELSTQVLLKHLSDKEIVYIQSGCEGYNSNVADDFTGNYISILTQRDTIIPAKNIEYKNKLDKIILENSSISLKYKTYLIKNLEKNEQNYTIIRKIALEANEPEAITALAKYQKKSDKKIILKALKNNNFEIAAIRAVKEFPEKVFYSKIMKIIKTDIVKPKYDYPKWRLLYQTLAKYPNEPKTIDFYENTFNIDSDRRKTMEEYLWMAITKYPNPKFEYLKSKLNINENLLLLEERDYD